MESVRVYRMCEDSLLLQMLHNAPKGKGNYLVTRDGLVTETGKETACLTLEKKEIFTIQHICCVPGCICPIIDLTCCRYFW